MLFPRKIKFKKYQKAKNRFQGTDNKYFIPKIGSFGLKVINSFRLKSKHIETVRKIIKKKMLKKIREQIRLNIFPDLPVTCKSSGLRMGKGKGHLNFWCFPVVKGRILFEITSFSGISKHNAITCLLKSSKKLPSICKIIIN